MATWSDRELTVGGGKVRSFGTAGILPIQVEITARYGAVLG